MGLDLVSHLLDERRRDAVRQIQHILPPNWTDAEIEADINALCARMGWHDGWFEYAAMHARGLVSGGLSWDEVRRFTGLTN